MYNVLTLVLSQIFYIKIFSFDFCKMCFWNWDLLVNIIGPILTFLSVVTALFRESILYHWFPPNLKIEIHNNKGEEVKQSNSLKYMYYHLRIRNTKPSRMVKNCQVILSNYWYKCVNGDYKKVNINIFKPFVWSPGQMQNTTLNFNSYAIFDFIYIELSTGSLTLVPVLKQVIEEKFKIKAAGEVLFELTIISDSAPIKNSQYFKIDWNGQYPKMDEISINELSYKETKKLINTTANSK